VGVPEMPCWSQIGGVGASVLVAAAGINAADDGAAKTGAAGVTIGGGASISRDGEHYTVRVPLDGTWWDVLVAADDWLSMD
jgi:hypothetical protein